MVKELVSCLRRQYGVEVHSITTTRAPDGLAWYITDAFPPSPALGSPPYLARLTLALRGRWSTGSGTAIKGSTLPSGRSNLRRRAVPHELAGSRERPARARSSPSPTSRPSTGRAAPSSAPLAAGTTRARFATPLRRRASTSSSPSAATAQCAGPLRSRRSSCGASPRL